MASLNYDSRAYRYQTMVGTGGIGTGAFFALDGNHTLGREESRSGHFLDRRDYCKLHIISHYVKVLLGDGFQVIPVGKVGGDGPGHQMMEEMREVGLNLRHVELCPGEQTLYSFCFLYPDGSGGNLTVSDSVCNKVDPAFVSRVRAELAGYQGNGIALAVPEVPLIARRELLKLGTEFHFLRVAAFVSAEIQAAIEMGLFGMADLLALNLDEAAAVAGMEADRRAPLRIVEAAVGRLVEINPALTISVTAGKSGSWVWDGVNAHHVPAFPVPVVNTAGAGDAFLAGVIAGLVCNLDFLQAQELGTLVGALSVTSPHTIHPGLERGSLYELSSREGFVLPGKVINLLKDT